MSEDRDRATCECCEDVEVEDGDRLCERCWVASGGARDFRDECDWEKEGAE